MSTKTSLKKAIKIVGSKSGLAKELGISYQSMDRWMLQNAMPCTDFNGETMYSKKIEKLTGGQVTIKDLLGWVPLPQTDEWTGPQK